jgi:hypothetical protein
MDYDMRVIVKGMKKESFKGYAWFNIGKKPKKFDTSNIEELMAPYFRYLAGQASAVFRGKFSIVPIPSSNMAVGHKGIFRSVELANMLLGKWPDAIVEPVLFWDKPKDKQHKTSGFRHPDQFQSHFRLAAKPSRPVILFDDIMTSGSQMIAAYRFLAEKDCVPVYGLIGGRSTKIQHPKMLLWSTEKLQVGPSEFGFDW